MKLHHITGAILFLFMFANIPLSVAQDSWSLQRCVDYALEHNIQVKQQEVQKRLADLTLKQSKMGRLPNLTSGINAGYSNGRILSPLDNTYTNTDNFGSDVSLSTNVDVFNWFSKQHQITSDRYNTQAESFLLAKARNDLAFNVATAFLQILLNNEQVKVNEAQVKLTKTNLENTQKLVTAGSVPESNQADLEAQLARDSSSLVTAQNTAIVSILQMKALLNLGFEVPFVPQVADNIMSLQMPSLGEMEPETVYGAATGTYPLLKADELKIMSAEKAVAAARARMYPSLSMGGGVSSYYSDGLTQKFGKQLDANFKQNVNASLSIPIFNRWQLRGDAEKAKQNLRNVELTRELDNQKLRQDIYKAHADAVSSLQKFYSTRKGVEASQKAFDFATKRFNLGLMNSIDYITTQTNLFKAQIDKVSAQYDYIFKMKLLEFYRDQKISL